MMDSAKLSISDIVSTIIFICVAIGTLLSNTLLIRILLRKERMQNTTNILIVALAVSDCLVAIPMILPCTVLLVVRKELFEDHFTCLANSAVLMGQPLVSGFLLLLVSLDRWIAINHPLRYSALVTPRRVKICIGITWVYFSFIAVLPLFGWNTMKRREETGHPIPKCHMRYIMTASYALFIQFHTIPMAITMVALYANIYCIARRQVRRIHTMEAAVNQAMSSKSRKGLRVLVIMTMAFLLSWLPIIVSIPLEFEFYTIEFVVETKVKILDLLGGLYFANAMFNPIFFILTKGEMRKEAKLMLLCKKEKDLDITNSNQTT